VEKPPPLAGRASELQILRLALDAAEAGRGSLLFLTGPAGIGKTRLLAEALDEAKKRGFAAASGVALAESLVLYHSWSEALRGLSLDHLLLEEPPPRLRALYLVSDTGLPVARAERPDASEDPALLAMMLNNAAEFVRDAIRPSGQESDSGILRLSVGGRGVVTVAGRHVALLAVFEGRESEIFLRELRRTLDDVGRRAGDRLAGWDGNKKAVADLAQPLHAILQSGSFDGVDLAADGQARKFNLFDNVLFGLKRHAATEPVLLVLDDLQWADSSSLGLLHYLARNTQDAPVVLLGAFRSEDREHRQALREALTAMAREDLGQEISLTRLQLAEARLMADGLLGAHKLEAPFVERLWRDSDGNPLILREVLRQLKDTGVLALDPSDGLLRLARSPDRFEVPTKIREAVGLRIASMERGDRELLDAASVCGTRFGGLLLANILGEVELKVVRQVASIHRHTGLVQPAEAGWQFEHPIVREVVYEAVPNDLRRLLHLRAAEVLQATGGARSQVGEHYAEAGDGRAVAPLQESAEEALGRGAPEEAARLLAKALGVSQGPERAPLEMRRAHALEAADQYDEALGALDRAASAGAPPVAVSLLRASVLRHQGQLEASLPVIEVALAGLEGPEAAQLLVQRARAFNGLARFRDAEEAARAAFDACPERELGVRADALYEMANSAWLSGNHARAIELLNKTLRLRESADDRRGVSGVFIALGTVLGDQGQSDRAVELLRLGLALNQKIGDRRAAALCKVNIAHALADRGELQAAMDEIERASDEAQRIGSPRILAWSDLVSAIVLARRGKSRDAVNRLERVAAEARRFGELSLLAAALAESVAPRLAIKERNRALEDAKAAVQLATKIGAKSAEGAALRALGLAVAANDGLKAAEGHFEAAVARYTALDNQLQAAETHSAWGDALRAGGQPVEAKAHYGLAVALFEAGSLRRRAAQARTSLVALAQ